MLRREADNSVELFVFSPRHCHFFVVILWLVVERRNFFRNIEIGAELLYNELRSDADN